MFGRCNVYGIQAINANNGWAMALAGSLIVMCGLSVLSFIISQLHKVVEFMEKRNVDGNAGDISGQPAEHDQETGLDHDLSNLNQSFSHYRTLTTKLGDVFPLQELFTLFREKDFPHPHLTIRSLREEGFLIPADDGRFAWKN